jgi:hypothetical protein
MLALFVLRLTPLCRFKYNAAALRSALLPSLSEADKQIPRSRKRRRLDACVTPTDPSASCDLEYGVVLETPKERFLVVRHDRSVQPEGANTNGANGVVADKLSFTISLIQGEVEVKGVPTTRLGGLTPASEEPKSPLPAPVQPTKEPSPVEPLPPVSTPQEVKKVIKDSERGRSTSIVDMELDTPASVTPTATGPDISDKKLPVGDEDAPPQNAKTTAPGDKSQSEEMALPMTKSFAEGEITPLKPPPPASVIGSETAPPAAPPVTSVPASQPEASSLPLVSLKLQVLQRNIRGEDLVFGDDGLGVLSVDVDPLDDAKKGWLIEAPRWRRYNGRMSDCIVDS